MGRGRKYPRSPHPALGESEKSGSPRQVITVSGWYLRIRAAQENLAIALQPAE
jgi:hypothetical protein